MVVIVTKQRFFCRIEGYFKGHASVCIPCIGNLGRVERSRDNHTPARVPVLVLIPLYTAYFLVFTQNIKDRVVYGPLRSFMDPFPIFCFQIWQYLFHLGLL